jgi:ABC-2 type transport system ATP-binding protein
LYKQVRYKNVSELLFKIQAGAGILALLENRMYDKFNLFFYLHIKGLAMTQPAIVAEGLTYTYGDLVAVDHIDFCVDEGEIIGFLGPNGAGKSTTVKMLTGQIRPKAGKATVLGYDTAKQPKQLQSRAGVCFENTNLYEELSGEANLRLFARLFNIQNFDAQSLLSRVGLGARGKDIVARYSKGMKQRLMMARALLNRPDILFLDEPTGGLDPVSSEAIRNIILEERQRGATIFLTTHDMLEADKLSDRVAFINQGKIAAMDAPLTLKQRYGKRSIKAQVAGPDGRLEKREILLDSEDTAQQVNHMLLNEKVVTIHSDEATLEDIFIQITGRGLA